MCGVRALVANQLEITAVFAFRETADQFLQLTLIDKPHPQSNFLEASYLQSLPVFDRRDVVGGLEQTRLRAGVEPGHAASEEADVERVLPQID